MRSLALLTLLLTACATVTAPKRDGVRVAVSFDVAGERGASAEGIADPASGRRVTPDDPVRIASISKLVVAIGVMRLVEQGRLDLDRPVGDWLGYQVENPAFRGQKVTLRQLLGHTSSLRDHDDQYAIPLGGSLRAVLADSASWDPAHGPHAAYFAYANMNFPVVASVMERATGERFDRLMQRLVILPMRLDACFNWPTCTDARVARAIELDQDGKPVKDDLHGRRPACPVQPAADGSCELDRWHAGDNGSLFAPQGGLRISARDLARVGRMLLGQGTIDGARILTPASVAAMIGPAWRYDGRNGSNDGESEGVCAYGLAIHHLASGAPGCADDPEGKNRRWIGHSGDAYGLRSGLWIDRDRGVGVAYFTTGLPADPRRGRSAFTAAEEEAFHRAVNLIGR
ncbi:MAG: beta-lactamase family protein [Sphingomonas sp.]|uniref:serine hydrolase domain-containing protein n=1 Tax=Sphingomonas sp. TaxID=28214 RepID=UPI0017C8AA3F|nr:serine hydrolase domain-containing protein [Sphingomonas sp.]MBA3666752.1 beta-lactamase family protein [Sphingomonas sp.]